MNPEAPPLFVHSVSDLTAQIKQVLESGFALVWVAGEISSFKRAGSGHLYFNLKDAKAVLPAVMWRTSAGRLRFKPHDGLQIIVKGRLSVYEPHGEYRFIVDEMQPKGLGAADLALRQLKDKLAALGYFDPARKRRLPTYPRRLALLTSPTGAAVRDMLEILQRRWPSAEIWICPVRVQGAGANEDIAWTFALLNRLSAIDVVILGRGGGSSEDLSAFNDELVARAIFNCRYPVISAVGHEIDVTIADMVADRRALTPSEAAEIATPDRADLLSRLDKLRGRLRDLVLGRLQFSQKQLAALAQRPVLRLPFDRIRVLERRLDDWQGRLGRAMQHRLTLARKALEQRTVQLEGLSPLNVLARGYSLTRKEGTVIRSAAQVQAGDVVETTLAEGKIVSRVDRVIDKQSTNHHV